MCTSLQGTSTFKNAGLKHCSVENKVWFLKSVNGNRSAKQYNLVFTSDEAQLNSSVCSVCYSAAQAEYAAEDDRLNAAQKR